MDQPDSGAKEAVRQAALIVRKEAGRLRGLQKKHGFTGERERMIRSLLRIVNRIEKLA